MVADTALLSLIAAIVARDEAAFENRLLSEPALARAVLRDGATRQQAVDHFVPQIGRYLMGGDTALHIAAAGYRVHMVRRLLEAGADPRARNRRGAEPLHAAAQGGPGSMTWNPPDQVLTINLLLAAGAGANAPDKSGATPLHKAVRTRCAAAVEALIAGGADPAQATKGGSTALDLAKLTTGRGGSGSPEAKAEQAEILRHLGAHLDL